MTQRNLANKYCNFLRDDLFTIVPSDDDLSVDHAVPCTVTDSDLPGDMEEALGMSQHYHLIAANVRADLPPRYALDYEERMLEIYYEGNMSKLPIFDDADRAFPQEGE